MANVKTLKRNSSGNYCVRRMMTPAIMSVVFSIMFSGLAQGLESHESETLMPLETSGIITSRNKIPDNDEIDTLEDSEELNAVDLQEEQEIKPAGTDMIMIPGGTFSMGSADGLKSEITITQVTLSHFYIDRLPVTLEDYRTCVEAGSCSTPQSGDMYNWGILNKDKHPINGVTWDQASDYCRWRGARLPTEAEWEFAARGTDGRKYPWGNQDPDNRVCWNRWDRREGTCEVGSYPDGASPFGVLDMSGNVWEWVADWYGDYPGGSVTNPTGPAIGLKRVLRGGAWIHFDEKRIQSEFRNGHIPTLSSLHVGFRCVSGETSQNAGPLLVYSESDTKAVKEIIYPTQEKYDFITEYEDMARIPAGEFIMGSADNLDSRIPFRQVKLSLFYLDRQLVTVEKYRRCVESGSCTEPLTGEYLNWGVPGKNKHPINGVTWDQARDYCLWRGARLPTEAEWEFAARGTDGRKYPWGNQDPENRVCWNRLDKKEGTCEVGSYPDGASPFGVLDMSGNVWEWISDRYGDLPGGFLTDPKGSIGGMYRVLRGGSWNIDVSDSLTTAFRYGHPPQYGFHYIGFRCARSSESLFHDITDIQEKEEKRKVSLELAEEAAAGTEMRRIPGNTFSMGSTYGRRNQKPVTRVTLSPFYMDKVPVTVENYAMCVEGGSCSEPLIGNFYNWGVPGKNKHPVNGVTWDQARDYCLWRGARLPTEAEWEYAARARDRRGYPWGKLPPDNLACWRRRYLGTCEVGSYPEGASPFGVLDMAGNVWEWVADWYGDYPGGSVTNPTGPLDGRYRVNRGGSWFDLDYNRLRTELRYWFLPSYNSYSLGFRCARTAELLPQEIAGTHNEKERAALKLADNDMIRIPGGIFNMGSGGNFKNEKPVTRVRLSPYYMDRLPVTVENYRRCVEEIACSAPMFGEHFNWGVSGKDKHPVNGVTWDQARDYCLWRGARLPTEAEWEFAARGTDGRKYPWGNQDPENRVCWKRWDKREGTCEVGSYPDGASPFGVLDMAGNVWEWVADWYGDYPGGSVTNPTGPVNGLAQILRGGSWLNFCPVSLRASFRFQKYMQTWSVSSGFRCVRDVENPDADLPRIDTSRTTVPAVREETGKEAGETRKKTASDHADPVVSPSNMIRIPGGTFSMGSSDRCTNESCFTRVTLTPYYMDRVHVTVKDYTRCVEEEFCSEPRVGDLYNWGTRDKENHPVNGVTWYQANQYCIWRGARLPTEAEWEYAVRGTDGRKNPWGNQNPDKLSVCWNKQWEGTCEVGSRPDGASPFGVLDLCGNGMEWLSDWYGDYITGSVTNPAGPELGEFRVLRGLSWTIPTRRRTCGSNRSYNRPSTQTAVNVFRCALEAELPVPEEYDIRAEEARRKAARKLVEQAVGNEEMIRIPAGTFSMGSTYGRTNQRPVTKVTLNPFFMDRLPVTVKDYSLCVEAGTCTEPQTGEFFNWGDLSKNKHPVNGVTWDQARSYCRWREARLPTEAEWEFAARGTEERDYPWGSQPPDNHRVCRNRGKKPEGTCEVGTYPEGASPFGVLDMSGNVWEWVSDWYGDYPGGSVTEPTGPARGYSRVIRGGAWNRQYPDNLLATYRRGFPPKNNPDNIGFRCVRKTE